MLAFVLPAVFFPPTVAAQAPPPVAVITEYNIPAGSFPHDPALDPGDVLWYTAQRGNKIGRLNPADGQVTEFAVPTANSGPHGLVSDVLGNIWFTENSAGKIGKLDPRTGQFTEYPMPDPAARDPHTPVFDQKGVLWFTVQGANRVGRLDPATGEVRLFAVPTANARPYGMKVDGNGFPWFAESGANRLGRIDPQSGAIQEFVVPDSAARPRRLAIPPNGDVYFTDFNFGRLGRFRPSSSSSSAGQFKLWDSPSGRGSQPYGIAADPAGIIWYNESAPGRIVRFDPRDESLAIVDIPTPGSVVRHMEADSVGRVWLAESGIDKIGKVEPAPRVADTVNAAGFSRRPSIAPGEIIAIFGTNLAFATAQARDLPLPRELGGVSVTVGGLAMPLFYVSPGQINAQVPFEAPLGGTMLVVRQLRTNQEQAGIGQVSATAPDIFVAADGETALAVDVQSGRLISRENPVAAGAILTVFASGLGAVNPPVASGAAGASQEPFNRTTQAVSVMVGGRTAEVLFSGLAPGYAGLYQLNVRLPSPLPPGVAQIQISAGALSSGPKFLFVR